MWMYIVCLIVGALCTSFGFSNMHKNASSLPFDASSYASEEDRIQLGRKIGLAAVFVGFGVMLFGGFFAVGRYTEQRVFFYVATGLLLAGLAVGVALSVYGILRYLKGIF